MGEAKAIGELLTTPISRESRCSDPNWTHEQAAQAKDDAILAELAKLALHYWRPDFTPAQAKHVYADFLTDLRGFAFKDILHAIAAYRRHPESRFFPHPGALRGLLETPPAWWANGKEAWLRDCRETAAVEMQRKVAAITAGTVARSMTQASAPQIAASPRAALGDQRCDGIT